MEILINVVGGFVIEVRKFVCKCIYLKIENIARFSSKIENLREKMEKITKLRDDIKGKVEKDEGKGYKPKLGVIKWIEDVSEVENEWETMQENIATAKTLRYRCCPNCSLRSEVWTQAQNNIQVKLCRLTKAEESFGSNLMEENYRMEKAEHLPGPSIKDQPTARKNLDKILQYLENDEVRDVAKWIANTFGDEHISVFQAGIGLTEISHTTKVSAASVKRISFICNRIQCLPHCFTECPKTTSLLLQDNQSLVKIPDKFFLSFPVLRVLNLSGNGIRALPCSINELRQLHALILQHCSMLKELPPIGDLCNLQLLDCDRTMLRCLPEGMDKLTNLRLLNMPLVGLKESIDLEVFHELQRLEMLHLPTRRRDVSRRALYRELLLLGERRRDVGATSFDEISHLPNLTSLFIYLDSSSISILKSDQTWMKRLKTFHITVGETTTHREIPFNKSTRAICLSGFDIFNNKVCLSSMLQFASDLYLEECMGLTEFIRNNSFDGLKSLHINLWSCDFGPSIEGSGQFDEPLPNLEYLHLREVDNLKSVSDFGHFLGLRFSKLRKLDILHCYNLTCLFNVGGAFSVPRHLEEISLSDCNHLTELLAQFGSSQTTFVSSEIPRVRKLCLDDLDALRTFGEPESMWEHLDELEVIKCNGIRKLPLSIQTSNNIKLITGSSRWWRRLEWDDNNYKSNLQHCFKNTSFFPFLN